MSPILPGEPNPWAKKIEDTIAEADAVRDGLHDDEAQPLMNWGADQARLLGARLAAPETPAPADEQVSETAYALVRLMTRITWVVTYRHKKDAAWLTRTFHKINDLNRELHGPDAPALSDDEIAAWIAAHSDRTNAELVQDLIARLTPPDAASGPAAPPPGIPNLLPHRGDDDDQENS